jgi:hypothetical protein
MPDKKEEKEDIIAWEWNDFAMKQMGKRLTGTSNLLVAFCLIAINPEDKGLNVTADILGDKSGPMPESDREGILKVFAKFEEEIKKIFGAQAHSPVQMWGHLKK